MVTFVSPGGAAGVLFTPVTFNSALTPLRPPLVSTTRPKGEGYTNARECVWGSCRGVGECRASGGERHEEKERLVKERTREKKKDSPGNREEKKGVDSKIVSGGR